MLRPELAAALGPERFLREITTTAQLNHPHILPLHDSGEADGFLYYVMPYEEGESLRDRLEREKQLPIEDALQIAREVATALSFAHSHDVVHRDIKPENILLAAGTAVVADFGIAKAVAAAGGERLTETGMAIGTPQYMSPEQVAGSQDIDGRSDLYGLGCVLDELLAGQPPFTGPTAESVVHQHLTAQPPAVTQIRETVPAGVVSALDRALAKAPADRFATASQLVEALTTPSATSIGTIRQALPLRRRNLVVAFMTAVLTLGLLWLFASRDVTTDTVGAASRANLPLVAVLPAQNLGAPEDDGLADGLALETATRLARLSGLSVIGYESVRNYRDTDQSADEIARELGDVDYLVRMTVQWQRGGTGPSRVRIVPRLVRAADGQQLWTTTYTESITDLFAVQSDVAEQIAGVLGVALGQADLEALEQIPDVAPEAIEPYFRGTSAFNREITPDARRAALAGFREALAEDSSFAEAWAWQSIVLSMNYRNVFERFVAMTDTAKAMADRALRTQPDLLEGRLALGFYHYVLDEYELAREHFDAVLRRWPANSLVIFYRAMVLRRQGLWRESADAGLEAARLDPLNAIIADQAGLTLGYVRDFDVAERLLRQATAANPLWTCIRTCTWHAYCFRRTVTSRRRSTCSTKCRMGPKRL